MLVASYDHPIRTPNGVFLTFFWVLGVLCILAVAPTCSKEEKAPKKYFLSHCGSKRASQLLNTNVQQKVHDVIHV